MSNTEKYKLCDLSEKIKVYTTNEHNFGTDAFLLSYFAKPKNNDVVCDFGTGCGIIPLILAKDYQNIKVYGMEIDKDATEQFKASCEISDVADRIFPVNIDIRDINNNTLNQKCSLITCNPPYFVAASGAEPEKESKKNARFDYTCRSEDICSAAKKLLKFGGKLCVCQRPERLIDMVCAMRNSNIEPKRIRFVVKEKGGKPWLVLIEGKLGANASVDIEPELFIYENGEYSEEMKKIYRYYQ